MAEDISVPDKERRQGMSYEEYSAYREKMRMQMENKKPGDLKPKQGSSNTPSDQMEKPQRDSGIWQRLPYAQPVRGRPISMRAAGRIGPALKDSTEEAWGGASEAQAASLYWSWFSVSS